MMQYNTPVTPLQMTDNALQRYLQSITNNTTNTTNNNNSTLSLSHASPIVNKNNTATALPHQSLYGSQSNNHQPIQLQQQRSITASPILQHTPHNSNNNIMTNNNEYNTINQTLLMNNVNRSYSDIPLTSTKPIYSTVPLPTHTIPQPVQYNTNSTIHPQPTQQQHNPNSNNNNNVLNDMSNNRADAEISFVHELISKERISRKSEINSLTTQLYNEREYNVKALNRERIAKENELIQMRSMLTQQYDSRINALKHDYEQQLTQQYSTYEQQLDTLKNEHHQKLEKSLDVNHELERQINDLQAEIKKYHTIESQYNDIKQQNLELSEQLIQSQSLQATYNQLNQQSIELHNKYDILQSDHNALQQQYAQIIELLQQSKQCIELRDQQLIELMQSNKSITNNNDQLANKLQHNQQHTHAIYDTLEHVIHNKYKLRLLSYWRLVTQHRLKQQQHTLNNDHAIQLIHIVRQRTTQHSALIQWRCAFKLRQHITQTTELHDGIDELRSQLQSSNNTVELQQQIADLKQQIAQLQSNTKQPIIESRSGDTQSIQCTPDIATYTDNHTAKPATPQQLQQPLTQSAVHSDDIAIQSQPITDSKLSRHIHRLQCKLQRERTKSIEVAMLWEKERIERLKQNELHQLQIQQLNQQINILSQKSMNIAHTPSSYHPSKSRKRDHHHNQYYHDEIKQSITDTLPELHSSNNQPSNYQLSSHTGMDIYDSTARDQLYLAYVAGQNTAIKNNLLLQHTAELTKQQARSDPILQHAIDRLNV